MAIRDSAAARETVATNFGLTADDLGVGDSDGLGLPGFEDFGDEGDGDDGDVGGDVERGGSFDQFEGGDGLPPGPDMGEGGRQPRRLARDQFGRDPNRRPQQQQQQPPRQQQQPAMPQSAEVRNDGRGNLVDRQGNIVARAGKEARWYQAAHNATRTAQQVQGRMQAMQMDLSNRLNRAVSIATELNSRVEQFNARDQEVRRLNITPQEQLEAMQLVAMGKTNPVQAIKTLLTRAAARGIDLSQLGLQGGADMATLATQLRSEIQEQMRPLRERSEAEKRQQEQLSATTRENNDARVHVAQFFGENPEARRFLPVIDNVLQRYPNMSLSEAWARIQLQVALRGNGQQPAGDRTRRRGAPPSGRSFTPGNDRRRGGGPKMAPVSMTYEQIARDLLNEAGVR